MNDIQILQTSESLLAGLKGKQKEKWDLFVERYGPWILQQIGRHVLHPEDAKDLSQDVLLALWEGISQYRVHKGKKFRGWLKTVVLNKVINFRRRRRPEVVDAAKLDGLREDVARSCDRLEEEEWWKKVLEQVEARVSKEIWQTFCLFSLRGKPAGEVARELGCSEAAVNMRVTRAKAMIKTVLEERGEGPPCTAT